MPFRTICVLFHLIQEYGLDSPEGVSLLVSMAFIEHYNVSLGENRDMQAKSMTVHLNSHWRTPNNASYRWWTNPQRCQRWHQQKHCLLLPPAGLLYQQKQKSWFCLSKEFQDKLVWSRAGVQKTFQQVSKWGLKEGEELRKREREIRECVGASHRRARAHECVVFLKKEKMSVFGDTGGGGFWGFISEGI